MVIPGCLRFQDSTCYEYEQKIADPTHRRGTLRLQCWLEPLAAEVRPTLNIVFNILFNLGRTIFNSQIRFLTFQKSFKQVITGWFFSSFFPRFSVPKWKTGCCQPEQLFQKRFIMNKGSLLTEQVFWFPIWCWILGVTVKKSPCTFQKMFWTIWYQGCQTSGRWQRLRGSLHGREAWGKLFFETLVLCWSTRFSPEH